MFFKGPFWGAFFGGAYIQRGLCAEGILRFKIDWASLIVGRKFTVFALFDFVFALRVWGTYIWRGLYMEGLIFGISRYPPMTSQPSPDPFFLSARYK